QRNGLSIVKESTTSIEPPGTIADFFLAATSFYELLPANIQVCFQTHGSLQWHDIKMEEISSERLHQHMDSVQKSIVQPWALESKWESFQIE
ncbi:8378_t:CDS:2, partial [Funneliformis caledonium]